MRHDVLRGAHAVAPRVRRRVRPSKTGAGALQAAYPLGVLVGSIPSGYAAARFGVKPTAVIALFVIAGTSAIFGYADSIVVLDMARFLQGIGSAFAWTAALAWLIAVAPRGTEGTADRHGPRGRDRRRAARPRARRHRSAARDRPGVQRGRRGGDRRGGRRPPHGHTAEGRPAADLVSVGRAPQPAPPRRPLARRAARPALRDAHRARSAAAVRPRVRGRRHRCRLPRLRSARGHAVSGGGARR